MPASITLFANNTTPTGPQLDNNFLAYAAFTNIPCSVAGTNTLTLTLNSNTPTLTQLTNYIQFCGVATATNTGAVTAQVGSFSPLNVYKDSPAGPVALIGGEIITNNAFSLRYDSALNSGSGGFHISTGTAFNGGTITNNLVLVGGAELIVAGSSIGATLTSALLTGNSLTVSGVQSNFTNASVSGLSSVASLKVGASAATVQRILSGVGILTYTVTPANSAQDQSFSLAGVQGNDAVALGLGLIPAGAGFMGYCSTTNTLTVRLLNPQATSIAATTLTLRAVTVGTTP